MEDEKNYDKLNLAAEQLEAALVLYIEPKDYISASTLAGAAGEVFHQYLKLNKRKTMTKQVADVFLKVGATGVGINKVRSALRDKSINFLKHRKPDAPLHITLSAQKEARDNLLVAIVDYKEIFYGNQDLFIYAAAERLAREFIRDAKKNLSNKKEKILYRDIAIQQLKQSIDLFLIGKYAAAITLSGAADNILISLLETDGKKCFSKIIKEDTITESGEGKIRSKINDMFYINAIKHLDTLEDRYIKTDILRSAWGAILKTLPNYKDFDNDSYNKSVEVSDFLRWLKKNLDPKIYHIDKI